MHQTKSTTLVLAIIMTDFESLTRDETAYRYVMPAVYRKGADGISWPRK
jgi:hypothetical protein